MITDPARQRRSDPGNPEVCPVYDLHKVFTPQAERESIIVPGCTTAGIGCLDCKQVLLTHALPVLTPISSHRAELARNPTTVLDILADGTGRAKKVASQTLGEVRAAMQI
jgi:tryptophanyl-tRNA synthetase